MSENRSVIGGLSQKFDLKYSIEWTIPDVFSFIKRQDSFDSPKFFLPSSRWSLKIYPNGRNCPDGWISLYLHNEDNQASRKSANYWFGVKKSNGAVEQVSNNYSRVFKAGNSHGCRRFLKRSTLQEKADELTTSGSLTVICALEVDSSFTPSESYLKAEKIGWKKLETEEENEKFFISIESNKDTIVLLDALCDIMSGLINSSDDSKGMLTSEMRSDATLKVGEDQFAVHKFVLASRCPKLLSAFEAGMEDKNSTDVLNIADCDSKAFRDFLLYLYTGRFQNRNNNAFEVYKIADKYDLEELKSYCVLVIINGLTVENVLDAIVFGEEFRVGELKSQTQDFFFANFSEIVSNAKWQSFVDNNILLAINLLKGNLEILEWKTKKIGFHVMGISAGLLSIAVLFSFGAFLCFNNCDAYKEISLVKGACSLFTNHHV